MSPADLSPAPGRRRPSLSADRILDVALTVVETDGADALTFKRLGHELGVAPTAVLRHFRDKDDLLLAMGDRLYAEVLTAAGAVEGSWRERLRQLAHATRAAFMNHPRVALLVAMRTMRRPAEFAGAELVIGALLDAGLDRRGAASLYRVFVDTLLAWSAFEASTRTVDPALMERDHLSFSREYLMLPADRYPSINAVAPLLSEVGLEDQFVLSIDLLLDAFAARAAGITAPGADGGDR